MREKLPAQSSLYLRRVNRKRPPENQAKQGFQELGPRGLRFTPASTMRISLFHIHSDRTAASVGGVEVFFAIILFLAKSDHRIQT